MPSLILPTVNSLDISNDLDLAIAGFLARYRGGTFRDYRLDLKIFIEWCSSKHLDPLKARRPHMELYVRWLEEQGWADATVNRRVSTVCVFYKYATIDDLIDKDPTVALKRPRVDRGKQKRPYLTTLEMAQYMQAAKQYSKQAVTLAVLLGYCGLRIGEATSLNIEDIRQEQGWDVITFTGKGSKTATIPIPVPVMRAIKESNGDRTEGPILVNCRGNRMTRHNAGDLINKVAAKAQIHHHLAPHAFRRTLITTLFQQGVSLYDVQKAARHSDPKTTQTYDMSAKSFDKNATHQAAAFYASLM